MLLTGAEILVKSLLDEGVDTVFGYPGGAVLIQDEDIISIDILNGNLDLLVRDEELAKRREALKPVEPKVKEGYLSRYAKLVSSASTGAVYK